MTTTDELSGIYHVAATTEAGAFAETEGNREEVDDWLAEFGRGDRLVLVVERELPEDECNGIWDSPGA